MPTHRVTLLPSGHQFLTSSRLTLLHAGLEAGMNLKFGCDGGNCGECLARLVSGELQQLRYSDYVLTPGQKHDGQFLSCCHAAASDLQIEVIEIGRVQQIPEQHIDARVYRIDRLSDQVCAIYLKTPRTQPLQFLAGQYVTVHLNDGRLSRNKSIASCPCDGLKPEIHIMNRCDDPFSDYVFNRLKKNETVRIEGPKGDFVLDDEATRPLILVAWDTGFASIKSLVEHAIALEKEQPIVLYWLLTGNNTAYLDNYCRALTQALDNFDYHILHPRDETEDTVRQTLLRILKRQNNAKNADFYVTLAPHLRAMAESLFKEYGLDPQHWKIDRINRLLVD